MKVAALLADRSFEKHGQDMLCDSFFAGLVNAFGSANVRHFPDDHPQFLGRDDFMTEWPFWLGAGCLKGKPRATFPLDKADVYLVNVRWLLNSVEDGLQSEYLQKELIKQIHPWRTVLIDSSDSPSWLRMIEAARILCPVTYPKVFAHRPGILGDQNDSIVAKKSSVVHISVPLQHIMRAERLSWDCTVFGTIFASLNDNGPYRRAIMHELVGACLPRSYLAWGSGSDYVIPLTYGPVPQRAYYAAMRYSLACVAARGAGVDCLRETEILALGSLLITQDPGWGYGLKHMENCLIYETPEECVEQCSWAITNPVKAKEIAREGQRLYETQASPEQQVYRIVKRVTG